MPKAVVQMRLSDGSIIDQWTSLSLRDTYTDPLGAYDFEFRPARNQIADYYARIQKGDLVGVVVDDRVQGAFIIQSRQISIGREGVTFRISAASVLATPYQASVDPDIAKQYATDSPVTTVVLEAMAPFGFDTILGDTAASRRALSGSPIGHAKAATTVEAIKHKDAQAQEGETAYGFAARHFTRLSVCLRVDHEGKLLLGSPDYQQAASYTLVQDMTGATPGNRMLDGIEIEDSNDDQFSEVTVRGVSTDTKGQSVSARPIARVGVEGGAVTGRELFSTTKLVTEKFGGHAYRSAAAVAPYKPKHILDKNARDAARCQSIAKLVMGLRAAKAFSITCEVDGMVSIEGRVWAVDTVANVVIEALDLREPMWILERTLLLDRQGQRTRLKLLPLGALVLGDAPT